MGRSNDEAAVDIDESESRADGMLEEVGEGTEVGDDDLDASGRL